MNDCAPLAFSWMLVCMPETCRRSSRPLAADSDARLPNTGLISERHHTLLSPSGRDLNGNNPPPPPQMEGQNRSVPREAFCALASSSRELRLNVGSSDLTPPLVGAMV
ncbi:unnamed protein product [Pleuronectes platessa]|uniref:Uncharacterized protein n=1 Tax=Pleuronectes platessa TaxID=8262 RepID=A0A9N7YI72_PLEPL|nr:unnamed protein product [Pleuronectes platessa]